MTLAANQPGLIYATATRRDLRRMKHPRVRMRVGIKGATGRSVVRRVLKVSPTS